MIAAHLGYGAFDKLSRKEKAAVKLEAEEAIAEWEEGPEMKLKPIDPKYPLQKLLRQYHDIGESILDIMDEEMDRDQEGC